MKNTEITFNVSENILSSVNQNVQEFTQNMRLYFALELFAKHQLTFVQASDLANLSREDFLRELDENEIDFFSYAPSELENELEFLSL